MHDDGCDYRARDDADTLKKAEAIKADRSRHGAAKKHLVHEHKAITNLVSKPKQGTKMTGGKKRGK